MHSGSRLGAGAVDYRSESAGGTVGWVSNALKPLSERCGRENKPIDMELFELARILIRTRTPAIAQEFLYRL